MRARAGMTLVEVMLAGSIAALVSIALMEALVFAVKVNHESSKMLAAEAYAWDTAWRWLNKSYNAISATDAGQWYPSAEGAVVSSEDCPELAVWPGSPARCWVRVKTQVGDTAVARHGVTQTESKLIEVDVEWGPAGDRRRLSPDMRESAVKSFNMPIRVMKCSIDRGVE